MLNRQSDVVRDYMRKYYGSMVENTGEKKPVIQKRMVKKTHLKKSEPTSVNETNGIADIKDQLQNEEKELSEKLLLSSVNSNRESFKKPTNDEPQNFGLQFQKQMLAGTNVMSSDSKFDSNANLPVERGSMLSRRDLEQKFGQSMRAISDMQESKEAFEQYKAESERFIREINGSLHRSLERDFLDNVVKPVKLMDMSAPSGADKLTSSQRSMKELFPQNNYEDMMMKEASPNLYNSIRNIDKTVRSSVASLSKNEPTENLLNYNSIQSRESKSDIYSEQEILDRILSGPRKQGDFRKKRSDNTDTPSLVIPTSKIPKLPEVNQNHSSNHLNAESESYPHLESIRDLGAKFSINKITDSIPKDQNGFADIDQRYEDDEIPQFKKDSHSQPKKDSPRNSDLPSFTKKNNQNLNDSDMDDHEHHGYKVHGNLESNYNTVNDDDQFNYQTERQLSVNEYFSTPSNQELPNFPNGLTKGLENRPKARSITSQNNPLDQSVDPDTLLPSELIDRNIQKKRPLFDNFDCRHSCNLIYDNQFEEPNVLEEEFESEPTTKMTILPGVVRNSDMSQKAIDDQEASRTMTNAFYISERNKLSFKQVDFFKLPEGFDQPSKPSELHMEPQTLPQANHFKKGNEAHIEYEEEMNFETEKPQTLNKEIFTQPQGRDESSITDIEAHRMLLNVQSENSDRVMIDMNTDSRGRPIFKRQTEPEEEEDYYPEAQSQDDDKEDDNNEDDENQKPQSSEEEKENAPEHSDEYDSEKVKRKQAEFDEKFNNLIGKMLNAKATIIQRKWLEVAEAKRESVQIDTLFSKFLQLKKAAIKANKYQIESKVATQTHQYSLKAITKDFHTHIESLQKGSPMVQTNLRELLKHLHVLLMKLNIVFES